MEVREAKPADAEAIRDVHYTSIVELGPEAYSQRQVDAWAQGCESARYADTISDEKSAMFVAETDDTVVGFGTLTLAAPDEYEADPDAEIAAVYVHPDAAQEGVGTRLYGTLEQRARQQGVGTLGLWASRNAVPFYESQGYERVTEHVHEFTSHEGTAVTGTVVEMQKEL
jgi:putative acetyltransferase